MAKSKYATQDGVCIAKACKGVHMAGLGRPVTPPRAHVPDRQGERRQDRHQLHPRRPSKTPAASNNPLIAKAQWVKPWPDPSSFMFPLFPGASISPTDNLNCSLVGITPAQAARLGVKGTSRACRASTPTSRGATRSPVRRAGCYAALDRKLTIEIVARIPFLWRNPITILGPQVAKWAFDQSAGTTALRARRGQPLRSPSRPQGQHGEQRLEPPPRGAHRAAHRTDAVLEPHEPLAPVDVPLDREVQRLPSSVMPRAAGRRPLPLRRPA